MVGEVVSAASDGEAATAIDAWARACIRITRPVAFIGVIGMLGAAGTTVFDILLRWLTKGGLLALNEIVGMVFAVAVAATIPSGLATGVNITIDMLAVRLTMRQVAWLRAFGAICLLVFFTALTWRVAIYTADTWARGRTTVILQWPVAPFILCTTLLLGFSSLIQSVMTAKAIQVARRTPATNRAAPAAFWIITLLVLTALALIWIVFNLDTASAWARENTALVILAMVAAMWVFMLGFVPLAAIMGMMGILGAALFIGTKPSLSAFASETVGFLTNYQVATLPLFLLMGTFAARAGIANDVYRFASAILGSLRGGLAMATITACAGFGAVTGSSLATVATFGGISLPEMRARKYDPGFSAACVAAGGTLGALIPPSGPLILFALLTEASIGKLFVAAFLPGFLTLLIYLSLVAVLVRVRPGVVPAATPFTFRELFDSARKCGGVAALFGAVIGGMYSGIFSATEAASVGVVGAFLLAIARRRIRGGVFWTVMAETTASTAMIYGLIFGVAVFSFFVDVSDTPQKMSAFVAGLDVPPLVIITSILIVYLILGCIMDSYSVMIVTVPIVTAVILHLNYDLIWWGIINLAVVEIGLITPPFGIHLFVLRGLAPDVSLERLYKEILPFCCVELFKLALLVLFPIISLWLPSTMGK